jgi:acetylornithine/N-succinyldiaminopimelate aminotransferase
MNFPELKNQDQQYVLQTYARFDAAIESGKNARCKDFDGKQYIDFTSGIGVNSFGFCDDGWIAALTAQLQKLQHTSNLYYTEPCIMAAKMLCEKTGMDKVFFANSGAEANEGAIKAARKYSFSKYGPERSKIVTLSNSFHGRTITTLAATGQEVFHNYFFPFTEGFSFAIPNDIEDTLSKMDSSVCAVMLELVQGEGGVMPLDASYVQKVAAVCKERDILLIDDEVQTGVGRTGSLYCFSQYGIQPDIVTSAKGLGGGLPFGAILFSKKTAGALGKGDHATTFGGNPVISAGACYILENMTEEFLQSVSKKGTYLREKISRFPHVKSVTGLGLMIGVELGDITAAAVIGAALQKGLLLLSAKSKVRMLPPLSITYPEIDEGLGILEEVLSQIKAD